MTHWFDSGDEGEPYRATVRLTGRRIGVPGPPGPKDTFVQEDKIERIVPGSGPVSVTSWVYGIQPGEWTVTAELLRSTRDGRRARRVTAVPLDPARWSWRRWALSSGPSRPVKTRWAVLAPLARIPGVLPGSWTALAVVGSIMALITQATILSHQNAAVGQSLFVSLVALLTGMLGAKVWYAVLHPGPWRQAILGGWALDGLLVVALAVAVVMTLALNQPSGRFLDSAAPGVFFGLAIARIGCFLTGCCAGGPTGSRWGVWSSDRRVGTRRIPAQLLESAAALAIGLASELAIFAHVARAEGVVFVISFATYALARQAFLRMRAEPRRFSWRRSSAATAAT